MKVRAHLIPPGAEEERNRAIWEALSGIAGPDYSSVYYLSPTEALLEEGWRLVHEACGPCYIPPVIATPQQLAKRLFRTYNNRTLLPQSLVPPAISALSGQSMGLSTITAGFIRELKETYPLTPLKIIKETLATLASEFNVPEVVAKRLDDALSVFEKYEGVLTERALADESDAMASAAGLVRDHFAPKVLILDGFYETTPAEEALIRALIEKAETSILTVPISDINDNLSHCYINNIKKYFNTGEALHLPRKEARAKLAYYPAPSMEEEVEAIAGRIKIDFARGRVQELNEVLVVFPSLNGYREMVGRVFEKYGVPIRFTRGRPLSKTRPYLALLALLEAVREGYPRLRFASALTSPHFTKISEALKSRVPRICLDAGLVKGRENWLRAFRECGVSKEGAWVFGVLKPLEDKRKTYGHYIGALKKVSRDLGFEHLEDAELDSLLDSLTLLDVFTPEPGLASFIDSLRRVLDSTAEKVEGKGVRVAEMFEARGLAPRVLYMGGLKDGDIPSRPDIDLLLSEGMRKRLGLSYLEKHLSLQEKIFRRLISAAGTAYLSYPTMEGDKFFVPSTFLTEGEPALGRPPGIFSEEERMLRGQAMPLSRFIREVEGVRSVDTEKPINVTDIDAYRRCPRLFFIERVLGLEPTVVKDYEIEPRELGIILHKAMERLIGRELGDLATFTRRAVEAIDKALDESGLDTRLKGLLRESFLALVPEIYGVEKELRAEGYVFEEAEKRVEGELVEGVRLKGKADRVDLRADGAVQIIDYKTGGQTLSGTHVMSKGEDLQLPLYAAMLRAQGMRPERVGIYSLKDMAVHRLPNSKDEKKGIALGDYISAALSFLVETVERVRKGEFKAVPLNEHTCRYCHESPYCPYIHGGEDGG